LGRGLSRVVNFLVIGKGNWSHNYVETINKHPKASLSIHLSARAAINDSKINLKYFETIIEKYNIDIIILSAIPSAQIKILKLLLEFKGSIILEKPLFTSQNDKDFFKNLPSSIKSRIFVNHFHFFSEDFLKTINKLKSKHINKIHIYDYGKGPNREFISPIFDWGPHSFGIVSHFAENFQINEIIKKDSLYGEKWFISLKTNSNIKIKILTGNGFNDKKRRVIFYDNSMKKIIYEESQKKLNFSSMYCLIDSSINNNQIIDTYSIAFNSCSSILKIKNFQKNS